MERAGYRLVPGRAITPEVQVRGERRPARGAHECVEVARCHGVGTRRIRQRRRFKDLAVRLQLPQQPLLDRRAAVLVFDVDKMKPPCLAIERLDTGHHAAPVPDCGERPRAGNNP